jgi:predicted DNA-binding protein
MKTRVGIALKRLGRVISTFYMSEALSEKDKEDLEDLLFVEQILRRVRSGL